MVLFRKIKKVFWDFIAPRWAPLRNFLLKCRIIWHEPGRQRYHIGWLRPDKTPDEFMHHLQDIGFHDHSLAWVDEEEYFGLRKLDTQNSDFQYHLRVFNDGEVRGHYEWTTEANWYKHFHEIGMEERREDFLRFLGDWIVLQKSGHVPDANVSGQSKVMGINVRTSPGFGKRYSKAFQRRSGARQKAGNGGGQ